MDDKKAFPALKAAFPHTLPILAGFIVLGMGYGIYLRSSGLPLWYPTLTSILVFGGSLEFLLVSMLLSPFQPISVFFLPISTGKAYFLLPYSIKEIQGKRIKKLISHLLYVRRNFLY